MEKMKKKQNCAVIVEPVDPNIICFSHYYRTFGSYSVVIKV